MPSIAIFTFDPQKLDEVVERRKQEQVSACGKTKILGEWCDTKNGRVLRLVEGGDLETISYGDIIRILKERCPDSTPGEKS